jgi:hypothetical protein
LEPSLDCCRPAGEGEERERKKKMKFMKLGSKPDAFQSDGADVR